MTTRGATYRFSKQVEKGIHLLDKIPIGRTVGIDYILIQNLSSVKIGVTLYDKSEVFIELTTENEVLSQTSQHISSQSSVPPSIKKEDSYVNTLYQPLEGITESIFKERSSLKTTEEPKPISIILPTTIKPSIGVHNITKQKERLILSIILKEYETKIFNKENLCYIENEIYVNTPNKIFILAVGRGV